MVVAVAKVLYDALVASGVLGAYFEGQFCNREGFHLFGVSKSDVRCVLNSFNAGHDIERCEILSQ